MRLRVGFWEVKSFAGGLCHRVLISLAKCWDASASGAESEHYLSVYEV